MRRSVEVLAGLWGEGGRGGSKQSGCNKYVVQKSKEDNSNQIRLTSALGMKRLSKLKYFKFPIV